jgi:hypothetical protein
MKLARDLAESPCRFAQMGVTGWDDDVSGQRGVRRSPI